VKNSIVIFIETPPQVLRRNNDLGSHNYAKDYVCINDVYTSLFNPLSVASNDRSIEDTIPKNPEMAEPLERLGNISSNYVTRGNLGTISRRRILGHTPSEGFPAEGVQKQGVLEPLK